MTDLTMPDDVNLLPEDEEEREKFVVDDDDKAAWAMRKAYQTTQAIEAAKARAQEEYDRLDRERAAVDAWVEQETADDRRFYSYLESLLHEYARRQRLDHDRKSLKFPYGKVSTTKKGDVLDIDDEQALVDYLLAEDRMDHLNIKPALSKVKATVFKDGESLPGVTPKPAGAEDFSVSVKPELLR